MELKEVQKSDIPTVSQRRNSKNGPVCEAVKNSSSGIMQIELGADQKLASVRSSLQAYTKLHEPTLTVFSRGDSLFVARKDAVDFKPRASKAATAAQ